MAISEWPAADRPREKLLNHGASALTDTELLAIFLRVGVQGKSAIDLARDMLEHFGSLRELLNADYCEFSAVKGLGVAKYAQLQATVEIARRYFAQALDRQDLLDHPHIVKQWLLQQLRDQPHEVFIALFLDARHRLIKYIELAHGSISSAAVHPREVVKQALQLNAAKVIFAHNHPSGVAEPSTSDELLTNRLRDALLLIDVQTVDHIVVGDGQTVSFAERGLL